jgi:hypothetical protein
MDIALGNYLRLQKPDTTSAYYFQNFFIKADAAYGSDRYNFLPFGFSGVSVNRNGDNTEASLVFPNNELSRAWALTAVNERWLARVYVMALDPNDTSAGTLMHQYNGQVAAGQWDETSLTLNMNTILDAVGADVPLRRLTQALIGNIPTSSNVRLR